MKRMAMPQSTTRMGMSCSIIWRISPANVRTIWIPQGPLTADNANATKVTDIIASLLADGTEEVAFAIYRKSSILPEFLKGPMPTCTVPLSTPFRPIVLYSCTNYEGRSASYLAILWDDGSSGPDLESDKKSENVEPYLLV